MTFRFHAAAFAALAAISCLPGAQPARAATATTTIAVSATVLSYCAVAALPLAFGNYNSGTNSTANTTVSVTCTNGTPYNVGLDQGTGSGATVTSRLMSGPSSATLSYSLYSNAGFSTVWGNTIGTNTVTGTGSGALQNLTVYGKIPSGQYSGPGAYADTVTVTVTY